jgi:hypothetical protein
MSTEAGLHPTKDWFKDNALEIAPIVQEPELPQPGQLSGLFGQVTQVNVDARQTPTNNVDASVTYDPNAMAILAGNITQVSENLTDPPKGMTVQPTVQSDLSFGIGSVLGVTKEALGIEAPEHRILPPEMNAFAQQNNLNANMLMRPGGGMFG